LCDVASFLKIQLFWFKMKANTNKEVVLVLHNGTGCLVTVGVTIVRTTTDFRTNCKRNTPPLYWLDILPFVNRMVQLLWRLGRIVVVRHMQAYCYLLGTMSDYFQSLSLSPSPPLRRQTSLINLGYAAHAATIRERNSRTDCCVGASM
jgi:hypothetical protein